jgi:hypothetical protein
MTEENGNNRLFADFQSSPTELWAWSLLQYIRDMLFTPLALYFSSVLYSGSIAPPEKTRQRFFRYHLFRPIQPPPSLLHVKTDIPWQTAS